MATITLMNLTSPAEPVYIRELYTKVPSTGNKKLVFSRPLGELSSMAGLHAVLAAGQISMSIAPTSDEIASGLASPPNAVGADDLMAVSSSDVMAPLQTVRLPFTDGGQDSADELSFSYPSYKVRVLDAYIRVSAQTGNPSLAVYSETGSSGTLMATFASVSTGKADSSAPLGSVVISPGTGVGFYVVRDDDSCAGEIVLLVRRES